MDRDDVRDTEQDMILYSARDDALHGTQKKQSKVGEYYRLLEWLVPMSPQDYQTLNSQLYLLN